MVPIRLRSFVTITQSTHWYWVPMHEKKERKKSQFISISRNFNISITVKDVLALRVLRLFCRHFFSGLLNLAVICFLIYLSFYEEIYWFNKTRGHKFQSKGNLKVKSISNTWMCQDLPQHNLYNENWSEISSTVRQSDTS
jgi:hypothetical protein